MNVYMLYMFHEDTWVASKTYQSIVQHTCKSSNDRVIQFSDFLDIRFHNLIAPGDLSISHDDHLCVENIELQQGHIPLIMGYCICITLSSLRTHKTVVPLCSVVKFLRLNKLVTCW